MAMGAQGNGWGAQGTDEVQGSGWGAQGSMGEGTGSKGELPLPYSRGATEWQKKANISTTHIHPMSLVDCLCLTQVAATRLITRRGKAAEGYLQRTLLSPHPTPVRPAPHSEHVSMVTANKPPGSEL